VISDLDGLERDVQAARDRLATDIARLADPSRVSEFRDDVATQAGSLTDDLVHRATEAASDGALRLWSDLKGRMRANPGAALAIGAGLAWHFARHPPITTLLVGLGLAGLMKTDPSAPPSPIITRAGEVAEQMTERVGGVTEAVTETVSEASEKLSDLGAQARETVGRAGEAAREWAEETGHATKQAFSRAASAAEETGHATKQAFSRAASAGAAMAERQAMALPEELRDNYLLGIAALAVGTAVVMAARRTD
jgi:hypothetical protein